MANMAKTRKTCKNGFLALFRGGANMTKMAILAIFGQKCGAKSRGFG
jgi:hypothetical protein